MKNLGQDISSVADAHARSQPVKLSRERWDSLTRGGHTDYEKVTILRNIGKPPLAIVTMPLCFDGIVFLPAEYVPAETAR